MGRAAGGSKTERVRGIVLRRTKLRETDLIISLLADRPSQIQLIAKGARKPGSKLAGTVGLGNEVDLLINLSRSLSVVREGQLLCSRASAARDYERAAIMEAILATADGLTAEGEHDQRLLPLTSTALDAVLQSSLPVLPYIAAAYVFKAASIQGYRPVLDSCASCGAGLASGPGQAQVPGQAQPPVRFSLADGGLLCADCADSLRGMVLPPEVLEWTRALIRLRFAEILDIESGQVEETQSATARLGVALLDLARQWLNHYPGINPRALNICLTLDYRP